MTASAGNGSVVGELDGPVLGRQLDHEVHGDPVRGDGRADRTTVTGTPPATSVNVTGLTNGTTYTFTVSATNAIGTGPASSASNAVTPSSTGVHRVHDLAVDGDAGDARRRPTGRPWSSG